MVLVLEHALVPADPVTLYYGVSTGDYMTYQPVHQPWAHQTEALSRSAGQRYFAYLMEMGTGKTKVAIDEFCRMYLDDEVDTVVIVAPKGVYMNWIRNELPAHMPADILAEALVVPWYSGGGNKSQRAQLQSLLEPHPGLRVFVVNTEAYSTGGKCRDFTLEFLETGSPKTYIVLDESTSIKNPTANRSKELTLVGDSAYYKRIMSGLPVPRGPLDMWSQAEFLRRGLLGQTFYAFRARYAILKDQRFGGRKVTTVVGYRNIEELTKKIEPWSYRVTKEECLDLPPKLYTRRDVELTEEQRRIYDELKEFAVSDLDDGMITTSSVITKILRLQQLLCGSVKNDDGEVLDVPTNRLDVLMECCAETDHKVIIWSRFRHDIVKISAALRAEYGEGSVAEFHGGNTDSRHLEAERFIRDPDCRFMVASYAGGHGNTWIVADTVIYYSNDFDLEKRAQSEDRAHRGGQTQRVTYIDIIARGTVDEQIVKALRNKISLASTITGDNYREWLI